MTTAIKIKAITNVTSNHRHFSSHSQRYHPSFSHSRQSNRLFFISRYKQALTSKNFWYIYVKAIKNYGTNKPQI